MGSCHQVCLNHYCMEIYIVGMTEALHGFIGNFDKHHAMVAEAISKWCSDTNTFLCQYRELGISLWKFIGVSHLPFEGRLIQEYVPFNKQTLSSTCQRLFQIFFEFNDVSVSYGSWPSRIC